MIVFLSAQTYHRGCVILRSLQYMQSTISTEDVSKGFGEEVAGRIAHTTRAKDGSRTPSLGAAAVRALVFLDQGKRLPWRKDSSRSSVERDRHVHRANENSVSETSSHV